MAELRVLAVPRASLPDVARHTEVVAPSTRCRAATPLSHGTIARRNYPTDYNEIRTPAAAPGRQPHAHEFRRSGGASGRRLIRNPAAGAALLLGRYRDTKRRATCTCHTPYRHIGTGVISSFRPAPPSPAATSSIEPP